MSAAATTYGQRRFGLGVAVASFIRGDGLVERARADVYQRLLNWGSLSLVAYLVGGGLKEKLKHWRAIHGIYGLKCPPVLVSA